MPSLSAYVNSWLTSTSISFRNTSLGTIVFDTFSLLCLWWIIALFAFFEISSFFSAGFLTNVYSTFDTPMSFGHFTIFIAFFWWALSLINFCLISNWLFIWNHKIFLGTCWGWTCWLGNQCTVASSTWEINLSFWYCLFNVTLGWGTWGWALSLCITEECK